MEEGKQQKFSDLYRACNCRNQTEVEKLLQSGVDVNYGGHGANISPLQLASERGHSKIVKLLLDFGAAVECSGFPPLCYAAYGGYLDVVKVLVPGTNVNVTRETYATPLYYAAENGSPDIVKYLVQHGADVNSLNFYGDTPMAAAAENGHYEVCKVLLDAGASLTIGCQIELFEAARHGFVDVAQLLLEHGAEVNKLVHEHETAPLYIATENNFIDMIELLLAHGADIHQRSSKKLVPPLFVACQNGNVEVVTTLLKHGANPNDRWMFPTYEGGAALQTPLHSAFARCHLPVARLLLEKGAKVDATFVGCEGIECTYLQALLQSYISETPTLISMIALLLEFGANVNALQRDQAGFELNPLHMAIQKQFPRVVILLVDSGARFIPYGTKTIQQLCNNDETLLSALAGREWTPRTHAYHPQQVKDAIFCALLIEKRQKWNIGPQVMHKIFTIVAHDPNSIYYKANGDQKSTQ